MRKAKFFMCLIGCSIILLLTGLYHYSQTDEYQITRRNDESLATLDNLIENIDERNIDETKSFEIKDEVIKTFEARRVVSDSNCQELYSGNSKEVERARRIDYPYRLSHDNIITETTNCKEYIRKRGYIMDSLTETERNFPLAYSIVMHEAPQQSERLLRAVYRPQNIYCIHVDRKANEGIYKTMEAIANCFDNVIMAPHRIDVRWGTMTVLESDLQCMTELMSRSATWKYFINLTGQEFPLKTNYELVEILKAYNGANDVAGTRKRANKSRWVKAGDPPHGIIPTKGNLHSLLSRAFVDFALYDRRAKDFLEWCRKVQFPCETYFSSLQHNPHLGIPGAYKGIPETFPADVTTEKPFLARYINWQDHNKTCNGKRVRTVCIFGVGDLSILADRKELFVNKLHDDFEPVALDCLEELIFNRTRDEYLGQRKFNAEWYKNLGFVRNAV